MKSGHLKVDVGISGKRLHCRSRLHALYFLLKPFCHFDVTVESADKKQSPDNIFSL